MSTLAEMVAFGLSALAAIFTIVNPVGNIPVFVSLTEGYTREHRLEVVKKAAWSATMTLLLFALAGNYIFLVFHTTIHAFRIAGGVLLFSIAFTMMHGERTKAKLTDREQEEALSREAVGVVPIGIPIFAGPGAITTAMVLMGEASVPSLDVAKVVLVILAILITMVISYGLLLRSDWVVKRFGRIGMMAFSRIMGLILAAIAVQFIIVGIRGVWLAYFVGLA